MGFIKESLQSAMYRTEDTSQGAVYSAGEIRKSSNISCHRVGQVTDASPRPGPFTSPERKQGSLVRKWRASSKGRGSASRSHLPISSKPWQQGRLPVLSPVRLPDHIQLLSIIFVLSVELWRHVLAAATLAFITSSGSPGQGATTRNDFAAGSLVRASMVCSIVIKDHSHNHNDWLQLSYGKRPHGKGALAKSVQGRLLRSRQGIPWFLGCPSTGQEAQHCHSPEPDDSHGQRGEPWQWRESK